MHTKREDIGLGKLMVCEVPTHTASSNVCRNSCFQGCTARCAGEFIRVENKGVRGNLKLELFHCLVHYVTSKTVNLCNRRETVGICKLLQREDK